MAWAWMHMVLEIYTWPGNAQPACVAAWMQARQTTVRGVVSMRAWGLGCVGAARIRLDGGRRDQCMVQYRCGQRPRMLVEGGTQDAGAREAASLDGQRGDGWQYKGQDDMGL